jgi:probable rRNA maturation factor
MTISPTIRFHFLKKISLRGRQEIKKTLTTLFKREKTNLAELQYIFVSDKRLLEINRQFLGHDHFTDIITFPLSEPGQPVTAEIYISVDRVRENAHNYGSPIKTEILRVIFHGALHLCGYGDKSAPQEREMRQLEEKYLALHFQSVPRGKTLSGPLR